MTALPPSPFLSDSAAVPPAAEPAVASSPTVPQCDAAAELFESVPSIPSAPTTAAGTEDLSTYGQPAVRVLPVPAVFSESSTSTGGHQGPPADAPNPSAGATARETFRLAVAEALTGWRLGIIPLRPNGAEVMIFREAMADIIRFRLRIAYMPLFEGLERIQARVGILASLRADPYAPPGR